MVDQESYTPPPWVFWCADTDCEEDNCTQTAHNGRFLIGTHAGGIHAEVTSGLADTRLMTAAPEMLEALQELVKHVPITPPEYAKRGPDSLMPFERWLINAQNSARAVLAKATGHD